MSTPPNASRSAAGARRPVLVGVAAETRHDAELPGLDHTGLMLAATRRALDDAGVAGADVAAVVMPRGSWSTGNPAWHVATEIGAPSARTVIAELGITQTTALSKAWELIADGADVVVVTAAETRHRDAVARRAGTPIDRLAGAAANSSNEDPPPDELLAPAGSLVSRVEISRHFAVPANQYAIVESVLRHHAGRTLAEHAEHLGRLWHVGAEAAAQNPDAWNRSAPSAAEIATPTSANRMIAAPYTKSLVSQWTVDQAAAFVFVAADVAARLASSDRHIHPLAAAESNLMIPLAERAELDRWPAMRLCGERVFSDTNRSLSDVDLIDLYSCFPAAVQVSAAELGIDLTQRSWTVTGGMTFGGGPLNNYTFQSVAKMAELLRRRPEAIGLTTSVSGFLTKPAVALWSSAPAEQCVWSDVTAPAAAATARMPVDDELTGAGTIAGYTVLFDGHGNAERAVAVVDVDGRRTVAVCDDPAESAGLLAIDAFGLAVTVNDAGVFHPA